MKNSLLILILIICTSCHRLEYEIDYHNANFPENFAISDATQDSLSSTNTVFSKLSLSQKPVSKDYICKTNKKTYNHKEKVILTVKNKAKDTVYFFPTVTESEILNYANMDKRRKKFIEKLLISRAPAIIGYGSREAISYISLHFHGLDTITAAKLKYSVFQQPLTPGGEMTFKANMPHKPGHYRFIIHKYSHSKSHSVILGLNNYFISNSFEIIKK